MDATSQTIPTNPKRISPLDDQRSCSLSRCGGALLSRAESCDAEQCRQGRRRKGQALHMVYGPQGAYLYEGDSAAFLR